MHKPKRPKGFLQTYSRRLVDYHDVRCQQLGIIFVTVLRTRGLETIHGEIHEGLIIAVGEQVGGIGGSFQSEGRQTSAETLAKEWNLIFAGQA